VEPAEEADRRDCDVDADERGDRERPGGARSNAVAGETSRPGDEQKRGERSERDGVDCVQAEEIATDAV
jgi:hypothetical protein